MPATTTEPTAQPTIAPAADHRAQAEQVLAAATLSKAQAKEQGLWAHLSPAQRQVCAWAHRKLAAGKHLRRRDVAARLARVEAEITERAALAQAATDLALPDKVSPDQEYTKYGLRWHRERLLDRLYAAGVRAGDLPALADLGTGRWDTHFWANPLYDLARRYTPVAENAPERPTVRPAGQGILRTGTGTGTSADEAGESLPESTAQVRALLAALPEQHRAKQYKAITVLGQMHAVVAGLARAGLPLHDALRLTAAGLDAAGAVPAGEDTAPALARLSAAANLLGARDITAAEALTITDALGGDPVKATLLGRAWTGKKMTGQVRDLIDELAGLGRHAAIVRYGTLGDVLAAHLPALAAAHTGEVAVAALTARAAGAKASENPAAVAAIRSVPVAAFTAALAAVQESDPSAEPGRAVRAALGLVRTFGRDWATYPGAVRTAARATGQEAPSLQVMSEWLPTADWAGQFGVWLRGENRLQSWFRTTTGPATLTRIAAGFADLDPAERSLPLPQMVAALRVRTYGPLGRGALGALAAQLNLTRDQLEQVAERWERATAVPTPFDLTARYADERSGLVGRFLPRTDPRGLFLGLLTDCCQYPWNAGRTCAWWGQESASSGFFVVEDADGNLVAQSWAWVDPAGRLCFDSVERKTSDRAALMGGGGFGNGDTDEDEWDDDDALDFGEAQLSDTPSEGTSGKGKSKSSGKGKGGDLTAAQARAWAILRVYRRAAVALLDRFTAVHVGPAASLPTQVLTEAPEQADLRGLGYDGYTDAMRGQWLLAVRGDESDLKRLSALAGDTSAAKAAAAERWTLCGVGAGKFTATRGTGKGAATVTVHSDGKVEVTGRGGANLAREVLAGMGPRTWTVRNLAGRTVPDPAGAGWTFAGPAALAA